MATPTAAPSMLQRHPELQKQLSTETGANPAQSEDPTVDAPQTLTGEEAAKKAKLDQDVQASLIELRRTFKMRYQPKRMIYVSEVMRAFEALR